MGSKQALHEKRKDRQRREIDDWRWLMNDARGRRIVASILDSVQLEETLFNGNSRDAFLEGRRALAREVLHRAKAASFTNYLLMQKEQHDDRTDAG